jgi:hypothetical protein
MFSFTAFFNGFRAWAEENIDSHRLCVLIDEDTKRIKRDGRWSFAVKRYIPILLTLFLALGCASRQPDLLDDASLEEQLQAYIDDYYDQVVGTCVELHGKAQAGESVVDCGTRGREMHVSFPSKEYHDDERYFTSIGNLYQNWCAAAGAKLGQQGVWVRRFRREGVVQLMHCRNQKPPHWPREAM